MMIDTRPLPDTASAVSGRASRWSVGPAGWGVLAAVLPAGVYVAVVSLASASWTHLIGQVRQDWPFLLVIVTGFGVQVGLLSAVRRARQHHGLTAAGAAGGSASVVGMVACCAHHIADLLPFVAATGAAAFLTSYRTGLMLLGIAVTAVGIALSWRRLHHIHARHARTEENSCHAEHSSLSSQPH